MIAWISQKFFSSAPCAVLAAYILCMELRIKHKKHDLTVMLFERLHPRGRPRDVNRYKYSLGVKKGIGMQSILYGRYISGRAADIDYSVR